MEFCTEPLEIFNRRWALLTAGDENAFNTMTIGWGGLGTLWGKPTATVYVKPIRYTHAFMEKSDLFTVSFFPERYRKALSVLGTRSGRDCDKVAISGLTPKPLDGAVTFCEADTVLLCKKIYRQDLDLSQIPADAAERYYRGEPVHTMYIGEVLRVVGSRA